MQNIKEKLSPAPTGKSSQNTIYQPVSSNATDTIIIPQISQYVNNIPPEMRKLKNWICHRNKEPYNVITGYRDKNIPSEWVTFEEALAVVGNYDGLGFRLNNNSIFAIDLDTCRNPATKAISAEALYIINTLDSFAEISLSGFGVHIFIETDINIPLPFNKKPMAANGIIRPCVNLKTGEVITDKNGNIKYKKPELEIYKNGRYIAMTGIPFGKLKPLTKRGSELLHIINLYNKPQTHTKRKETFYKKGNDYKDDRAYLQIGLEKDNYLIELWNGRRPCGDESADDLGLISKLGYWCNANADLMEQAFRESPYFAQKDAPHIKKCNRADYPARVIKKVLSDLKATAAGDNVGGIYAGRK